MAKQNERYSLIVKSSNNIERFPCKTFKEAKEYYSILSDEEKKQAKIIDNVTHKSL